MDYKIVTKGLELSDSLKNYLDKRLSKIDRIANNIVSADVRLSKETRGREIVEITIHMGNTIIRVEEITNDIYSSIDAAIDSLVRRIKRYKDLKHSRQQRAQRTLERETQTQEEKSFLDKIVKTKRFFMKPMSIEEAIMQLEMLGHSFFVFRNAETDEINVVYTRKDGNYGLIELEI
ncbi:MAG TPA: ribosome-associated translation inhibitor RaiA [Thermotogaceae bacterium]|nr:ribosome-associated translation inhibitor RaiA [Thermotogaceae bacterium]